MIKRHLLFLFLFLTQASLFAETAPQAADVSIYTHDISGSPTLDYGQSGNIHFLFQNTGTDVASGVSVTATTTDIYATLTNAEDIQLGSISGNGGIAETSGFFQLTLTDEVPDLHQVVINIVITADGGESWSHDVIITAHAPSITISAGAIVNDNDASGSLDPGETADITYVVSNTGHADGIFSAILSETLDPNNYMTLGQTEITDVSVGALQSEAFTFTGLYVIQGTPAESPVSVIVNVTAPAVYANSQDDTFLIGFTPTYCTSNATSTGDTRIDKVIFNSINNDTSGDGCATYSDFTSMSTMLTAGQTYPIAITVGSCGGDYTKGAIAYIDWNYDGDFDDDDEIVFITPTTGDTEEFTSTVTVPMSASPGTKIMRVVCSEDEANISPCGTYSYGETEDYTITIIVPTAPLTNFSADYQETTVGSIVSLTDNSINFPDTWAWSITPGVEGVDYLFTNGTDASSQNPTIQFIVANIYSVTLNSSNDSGADTEEKTDYITILDQTEVPTADFSVSANEVSSGDILYFTDLSDQSPDTWLWTVTPGSNTVEWEFVNGTDANSQNPEIMFNVGGAYDISLVASNTIGSSTPELKTNYVRVREVILMADGDLTTCAAVFFDSGGENGDYSTSEDFVLTIYPGELGSNIVADFQSSVETESCSYDWLTIYDGTSTSATELGQLCGTMTAPGEFVATNPDGALTFEFISDGSVTDPGWEAFIRCASPTSLPECADVPVPSNGEIGLFPTEVVLGWVGQGADSYDVYIGETMPLTPTANVTSPTYTPTLLPNTDYVWKVVSKNSNGESTGCQEWAFTTTESYNMTAGVFPVCDAYMFDTGGQSGTYGASEDIIMTFTPETDGGNLTAMFEGAFNVENCSYDFLRVYNGLDDSAPLLGQFCGTDVPDALIQANNPEGALTFRFHSDAGGNLDGWNVHIQCSNIATPECAVLTSPIQNSEFIAPNAVLTWEHSVGASQYDIYFGETLPLTPTTTVTDNFYAPTMEMNTTYVWKVVAKNAGGTAQDCEERTFTTSPEVYTMTNANVNVCSGLFLDSGGLDTNYSDNEDYFMTFHPVSTNYALTAEFRGDFGIDECSFDYLIVYNGTDFFAPVLGTYCASNMPLSVLTATNPDGALTFQFHSNSAETKLGWEAIIDCFATVGTEDLVQDGFGVFPNPTTGIFSVQMPNEISGNIKVYNSAGMLVAEELASEKYTNFDFSGKAKGLYFIKIETGGQTISRKIIID